MVATANNSRAAIGCSPFCKFSEKGVALSLDGCLQQIPSALAQKISQWVCDRICREFSELSGLGTMLFVRFGFNALPDLEGAFRRPEDRAVRLRRVEAVHAALCLLLSSMTGDPSA